MWNYNRMTSCAPKFSIVSCFDRSYVMNIKQMINSIRCCRIAKAQLPSQLGSAPSSSWNYCRDTYSDLSMAGQGIERGMRVWWGGGSKKTQLSILTVPGWRSTLTNSQTAPSQERKRNSLGGQGWNSKIVVGLRNSYRCYTWRGENGQEADEEMNKLQACKQWATAGL